MKRALPIFLLVLGLLGILGGGFWLWRSFQKAPIEKVEQKIPELSLKEKPIISLIPGLSCEYTFEIGNIKSGVAELEYEITYKTADNVTQGVPGRISVKGEKRISRKVLFGTESSGNRRCDKGVSTGAISLKYRDAEGQVLASLGTAFKIVENTQKAQLEDVSVSFDRKVPKAVILKNLGFPGQAPTGVYASEPYSVFASGQAGASVVFTRTGNIYGWNGEAWTELPGGKASFLGTYLLVSP